jgi:hypothetical protein
MVKLRFADLNAELDGDPKEIVSILRELGVSNQISRPITTSESPKPKMPNTPNESIISDDQLIQKLPSKIELAKMIEEIGKPFSFTLAEQQKKFFGGIIDTRKNQKAYSRFYDLHKYARDAIQEKYGGHWDPIREMPDGHQTTRYTWVEDEEKETKLISQAVFPSSVTEKEHIE